MVQGLLIGNLRLAIFTNHPFGWFVIFVWTVQAFVQHSFCMIQMIILFCHIAKLSKVFFVSIQYRDKFTVFTKGGDMPFTWVGIGNVIEKCGHFR